MTQEMIFIDQAKITIALNIADIIYIRKLPGDSHQIEFVTLEKKIKTYGTLTKFEKKTPEFFRCHRSYLVNLKKIKQINNKTKEISFESACFGTCPISRRKYPQILNLLRYGE